MGFGHHKHKHISGLCYIAPTLSRKTLQFSLLTVMDRFSKMIRFSDLPNLPPANEKAEVMVNHVFKIHGFSRDIMKDREHQFMSCIWKEFC